MTARHIATVHPLTTSTDDLAAHYVKCTCGFRCDGTKYERTLTYAAATSGARLHEELGEYLDSLSDEERYGPKSRP